MKEKNVVHYENVYNREPVIGESLHILVRGLPGFLAGRVMQTALITQVSGNGVFETVCTRYIPIK